MNVRMRGRTASAAVATILVFGVSITLGVRAYCQQQEEEDEDGGAVELDQLPDAVKATLSAVAPGAAALSAELEDENGVKVYEIKVTTTTGKKMEVVIDSGGGLVEIEERAQAGDLPSAVQKTLAAVLPGGSAGSIEKKSVVVYEIEKEIDGVKYELVVDATGRVLSIETDDD